MSAQDKLQVVLLGTTGSGKSASGNTILGKKVFQSHASTQSVTLSFQTATARVNGTDVTVVDTPGWHCTKISEDEVINNLERAILSLHGPYAFLLVISIGSYTHEDMQMIPKLLKILGNDFVKHTTILFSHYDDLESKSFSQFLKEEEGILKSIIQQCGDRVHTWNNKDTSSVKNMDKLLQDLKSTQKMKEESRDKKRDEKMTGKPQRDLMTFDDGAGNPDAHMKRCKKENEETSNKPNEPIRVVVLGMAGVGKTSTIKTILGKSFHTESSTPPVHLSNSYGINVKLIDSTGFRKVEEVKGIISQSLFHAAPGPHVILIVMEVGRVTTETLQMTNFIHACLEDSVAHTMIVFSRRDNLDDKTIEKFIEESESLKNLVEMHGNKFHALNNKDTNDQMQVHQLLEKISAMHRQNKGSFIKDQESHSHHRRERRRPENLNNQEPSGDVWL